MKRNLEIWSKLHLSFWGKILVIKMNILPRMIFLFQMIPILGGMGCFKNWRKDIAKFIWKGKKPGIKHKIIIDRNGGGLGFA